MGEREPYRNRIEILQGALDMPILRTLQWGPQHGHGTGQAIRARPENGLQIEHASLYPALRRLEREGWLASDWRNPKLTAARNITDSPRRESGGFRGSSGIGGGWCGRSRA